MTQRQRARTHAHAHTGAHIFADKTMRAHAQGHNHLCTNQRRNMVIYTHLIFDAKVADDAYSVLVYSEDE